jgi:hypothetical protein
VRPAGNVRPKVMAMAAGMITGGISSGNGEIRAPWVSRCRSRQQHYPPPQPAPHLDGKRHQYGGSPTAVAAAHAVWFMKARCAVTR